LLGIYFLVNKPVCRFAFFRALAIFAVRLARKAVTSDVLPLAETPLMCTKRPDDPDLPMESFFGAAISHDLLAGLTRPPGECSIVWH
jgi:hypothetical protein